MSTIKVTRDDNIKLVCKAADNAVHAYLNGDETTANSALKGDRSGALLLPSRSRSPLRLCRSWNVVATV